MRIVSEKLTIQAGEEMGTEILSFELTKLGGIVSQKLTFLFYCFLNIRPEIPQPAYKELPPLYQTPNCIILGSQSNPKLSFSTT